MNHKAKVGDRIRITKWWNGAEGFVTDVNDCVIMVADVDGTFAEGGAMNIIGIVGGFEEDAYEVILAEPEVDIRDQILKSLDIKVPDRPFKVGDYVTVHEGVHDFTYGIDTPMPFNATIAEGPDPDDEYCVDLDNSGESWYVTIDMLTHAERPVEPQQGSYQVQFQVIGTKADAEDIHKTVTDAIAAYGLDLRTNTEVHVDNWIPSTKKWVDDAEAE